ncbi:PD-(D/E)XK nuclease family protein [Blattabacterium cuenoti]|uniref:PD-(D/E)XK nuclease family protein n=1 Tax=Blattabacterium cuenoti TaxID=1653831 RepID=UPI001EECD29F|nr:PD-(D/E)XK nuclease family protein [Blattabacterium cuenoti]
MNDFHDLDLNLIKLDSFFSSIISTEKMKEWNPNILEKKNKNLLFWEDLSRYYYILQHCLIKKGKAYPGMLFRIAFSKLKNFLSKEKNTQIVFLLKRDSFIEYERKFMNKIIQLNQESESILIYFFSKKEILLKNYSDLFLKKEKKISIENNINRCIKTISVSKEIEQVYIVKQIVYKLIQNGKSPHQIVLLLGDNYLSTPLFHSLKKITGINLSIMNYPFKYFPIHSTFDSFFQFLLKKEKFKKFYKKDLIRIFSDTCIRKIFFKKKKLSLFIENLDTEDSDFIPEDMINKYLSNNDLEIILKIQTNNTKKCITGTIFFIKQLKTFFSLETEKHFLELEFLSRLEVYMKKLKILVRKKKCNFFGIKDVFNIYQQFIKTEKIQYKKHHPNGLPVTGFMDDNMLDFENFEITIITSVNEGNIPPYKDKKKYNTFIPFDIRRKFSIPISNKENEEAYFHHFINILKKSKNVYLIYKNQPDELNSGEKSRFIHQIEMNSDFSTKTEKKENIPFFISKKSPIVIKKTESMIKRLYELSNRGISPSSLHLYNCNPLLFYYKKIIGLKNIEPISFKQEVGKIIHKILKGLYFPIKGQFLTLSWISNIKKNYESITKKLFFENTSNSNFSLEGKKMLIFSIVKTYIKNFISWDEKLVDQGHQILIRELEFSISTRLDLIKKVNLYGIIDRIDEYDGVTRIIDYKIGKIMPKFNNKEIHIYQNKIADLFHNPIYGNIMQLLIYVYLWLKYSKFLGDKKTPPIIGIVSPKKKGGENSIVITPINFFHQEKMNFSYKNYVENFLPHLVNRISEILDPKIPILEKK